MARVIYTPDGGSQREWSFPLQNPPWDVGYATEKATGWPWLEFADKVSKGSFVALRALLWALRKRDEPRLTLDAVTVSYAELDFDLSDEEEAADADALAVAEPEPALEDEPATEDNDARGEA